MFHQRREMNLQREEKNDNLFTWKNLEGEEVPTSNEL
jgi:hypothetical protein